VDPSNGYEEHAEAFMRRRDRSIGLDVVREWVRQFPPGARILELGCGHGVISQALAERGLTLYAVDASPTLLDAFRRRFPAARTECAAAEDSSYFDRRFDGAVAWGLIFLLPVEAQHAVIARVARALEPGGKFLFTAPREAKVWIDVLTEQESRSLGEPEYVSLLRESGCEVQCGRTDAGGNHYFFATKEGLHGREHQMA
jgi:2-polyprenyl-3-methyl-5-hydroxy-6-metoxy-1,4-benzoquinol methylase